MPASGITGANSRTPERYIGASVIVHMAQPFSQKAVPLLLLVRLMHGRIGILMTCRHTAKRRRLGDLGKARIMIQPHRQRRPGQQRMQGVLLQADLGGVGTTLQHPHIKLTTVLADFANAAWLRIL